MSAMTKAMTPRAQEDSQIRGLIVAAVDSLPPEAAVPASFAAGRFYLELLDLADEYGVSDPWPPDEVRVQLDDWDRECWWRAA